MKRLLNERTGTVHKPHPATTSDKTACGALRYVPQQHITPIRIKEHQVDDEIERCGRCFDDVGGYYSALLFGAHRLHTPLVLSLTSIPLRY